MTEPPTPSELDRRLERLENQQRDGFAAINARLDGFPTEQTIIALFAARDTQINTLQERVLEVAKELDQERRDRERAIKSVEDRADAAKRASTITLISGAASLAAVLGLILNLMGSVR